MNVSLKIVNQKMKDMAFYECKFKQNYVTVAPLIIIGYMLLIHLYNSTH